MAWSQSARKPMIGLLFRAQQHGARGYSYSAFQAHLSSSNVDQSATLLRRFSSEVPASEQMNLIKQLRERTSAPIKDVKASLVSCNWDIGLCLFLIALALLHRHTCLYLLILLTVCWFLSDAAQKDLRKRGVVLAAKKSSRTAAEGLLAIAQDEKRAAVVELNCETDFVARNDVFQYLVSFYLSIFMPFLMPTFCAC